MAVAKKKTDFTAAPVSAPDAAASPITVAPAKGAAPTASPARAMQDDLANRITWDESKISARKVTAMVIVTCAATWVAGVLLYATL